MADVAAGLRQVRARIAQAAERAGRDPQDVSLVAVSKRKPAAAVAEALAAGCRDFGENYVQELVTKAEEVGELSEGEPRWHYVGHLQRNKVNTLLAVPGLALIHGVDSARLLRTLDKRATSPLDVLIHVNIAGEQSKSGCALDQLTEILGEARGCEHVRVRGLMALPPAGDDPDNARRYFRQLRELREQHDAGPELSMGMSHDFETAVEEGATLVRVGTAIFGAREGSLMR